MALFQSGNPVLSEKKFNSTILSEIVDTRDQMSVRGTLNKFGFLFLLTLGTAYYAWKEFAGGGNVMPLMLWGVFGGLAVALIMSFKKEWSPYLAPAYALLEGLFVGSVSAYFENATLTADPYHPSAMAGYGGIVVQAVGLTFCVVAAMYLLYKFNVIRATQRFRSIVLTATVGIGLFYLATWIFSMFGAGIPGFLYNSSALGIGFSLLVVGIAAMNLIIDFDMIERGAEMGAPKYMEWYGAFGLLVTIVWLYIEILRLLSKLSRR